MSAAALRPAVTVATVGSAAALGVALASERWGGLIPCALCLWERWPYRVAIALGLLAIVLPRWRPVLAGLLLLALLAAAGLGLVHVGVEWHWWPSPLPECAAPALHGSLADRLSQMPLVPSKPCDEPTYLLPPLPVSMAAMNVLAALALGLILLISFLIRPARGSTR